MWRFKALMVLISCSVLGLNVSSCSRKKMSDRDAKKEQMRNTAQVKRQELQPAAGLYRGFLMQGDSKQDISLSLEIKDVPDTSTGEVDPVLVPILAGSMRLTFGNMDGGEFYSFGIQKADFDAKRQKIDIVVTNEALKEIVLSLDRTETALKGTWTAPNVSTGGDVHLERANDLNLKGENIELRGDYSGFLTWDTKGLYQLALLTLSTSQDKPDVFSLSANVKLIAGDASSKEALVYNFDQIEFNPLTHQISLKGTSSDIYFVGSVSTGVISGSWYSKLFGKTGSLLLQKKGMPEPPTNLSRLTPIGGTYYGTFKDTHPGSHLPSRIMLSLVPYHDVEKPGGLGVSGNLRFYFGSYSSTEYIELPFSHLEYNFFTRNLDAKTEGAARLTIDADLIQSTVSGTIADEALGHLGTFTASQTPPGEEEFSMAGDYSGHLLWDGLTAYQLATLNIVPTFSSRDGLKLTATAKLIFGEAASGEQLIYKLNEAEFNPTTGYVVFKSQDSDVTIKGYLEDGVFDGSWYTAIKGEMGKALLNKRALPPSPQNRDVLSSLKGIYRGRLRNSSSSTNLPERLQIGLVTSPDLNNPRGIKVSGNVRLYFGPFDSQEYSELYARRHPI